MLIISTADELKPNGVQSISRKASCTHVVLLVNRPAQWRSRCAFGSAVDGDIGDVNATFGRLCIALFFSSTSSAIVPATSRPISMHMNYTWCNTSLFMMCWQAHLLSVFDNIRTVTFEEKMYDKIVAMTSQQGEYVPLQEHVMAVVSWGNNLHDFPQAADHCFVACVLISMFVLLKQYKNYVTISVSCAA